ncbi:MAG: carbohydrate kinase family protein [Methanobacteriota archaeon]
MQKLEKKTQHHLSYILKNLKKTTLSKHHVVLLPDFFVDHFLHLDTIEQVSKQIQTIHKQGGGNLPGVPQTLSSGGNAANTALALAKLGISTHLICRTNALGYYLLQFFLGQAHVDLSGVKTDGTLALTTALEFGKQHVNIMLGDPGSVSDFSYELLDDDDLRRIEQADLVCVVNWNLNTQGTDLAQNVFKYTKKHGGKTFFDSGDPSPRKKDIIKLQEKVLKSPHLDIFGLNENELRYYSGHQQSTTKNALITAAKTLKKTVHARLDFHTAHFACTLSDTHTIVPTFTPAGIKRTTGAGDAWNAGDIFGELLGFTDEDRLHLANLIACYYISAPYPIHPTIPDLLKFIG